MLTGPEIPPQNGLPTKYLTVFLHGVGADGEDLIGLAPKIAKHFPDMHFISPNAPFAFENAPFGYQWFSLSDTSTPYLLNGLNKAMPHLNQYIDHHLKRFDLNESNLIVIGFSQGTMLALHTLLRRPKPAALIVGLSGMMINDSSLNKELNSKPSVLLMHGGADTVIPLSYMNATYSKLNEIGVKVDKKIYPSLGHSISLEEISDIIPHIKTSLNANSTASL